MEILLLPYLFKNGIFFVYFCFFILFFLGLFELKTKIKKYESIIHIVISVVLSGMITSILILREIFLYYFEKFLLLWGSIPSLFFV